MTSRNSYVSFSFMRKDNQKVREYYDFNQEYNKMKI